MQRDLKKKKRHIRFGLYEMLNELLFGIKCIPSIQIQNTNIYITI